MTHIFSTQAFRLIKTTWGNKNRISFSLRTLFLFVNIVLVIESNDAQSYQTINYTVENGLPSSEVYHVIQDRQGYIWFATNLGVGRFNGYEFQNFSNLNGLPGNSLASLSIDCNILWIGTSQGLGKVETTQDTKNTSYKITSYLVTDDLSSHRSISKEGVKVMIIDGDFLKLK